MEKVNLGDKFRQFADQQLDLTLLLDDDLVQSVQRVFGEARLDLQIGEALFGVLRVHGQRMALLAS